MLILPVSGGRGSQEHFTVNGLTEGTRYTFAVAVMDKQSNASTLSNVVSDSTLDRVAPEPILSLTISQGTIEQPSPVAAIASSGDVSASWSKEKATDGNPATAWSTPPRSVMQTEFLTVDTGAHRTLALVRLRSRNVGDLFPEDFEIQVSSDPNVSFQTVVTETGFIATPDTSYAFPLPNGTAGRYLRVLVTKPRLYEPTGQYYVQLAEVDVVETVTQSDRLLLTWQAPHEDGPNGGAVSEYDVRYSTGPIDDGNFNGASIASGIPSPSAPETEEVFNVTGLAAGTTYYFAIKSKDDSDNWSPLSNVESDTPGGT